MKTYMVRSYVAVEINIDAESAADAIEQASEKVNAMLLPSDGFDYMEDAIVYDQDGEEIDIDEELEEAAE